MFPHRCIAGLAVTWLALLMGCGDSGKVIDPTTLADAQNSYDMAMDEIAAKNTEEALTHLDVALQPGAGLPADIYVDARIQRAICLARVDRFADAHADLDNASEGAGDMSAVHAARSFVFSKEGKGTESKQAMRDAKKINKSVSRIRD